MKTLLNTIDELQEISTHSTTAVADSSYQAVVLESENQLKKYQSEDMSVKFLPFICFCLERRIKLF